MCFHDRLVPDNLPSAKQELRAGVGGTFVIQGATALFDGSCAPRIASEWLEITPDQADRYAIRATQ